MGPFSVDAHSQESANLRGKAVEMITNAIAEMRSYGEGFIIADQAPGLLDPAVIRNTNTKIILRLPDAGDRELAGKAAGLDEKQLPEIARLPTGVAAVYQNDWLEAVLCRIPRFEAKNELADRQRHHHDEHEADRRYRTALVRLLLADRAGRVDDLDRQAIDLNELSHWLRRSDIPARTARTILVSLKELADGGRMALWDDDSFGKLARVVADLVDFRRLYVFAKQRAGDLREWNDAYRLGLTQYLDFQGDVRYEMDVLHCLLHHHARLDEEVRERYFEWREHVRSGWLP